MAPILLLLGLLLNFLVFTDAQSVGVCYGQIGDGLPVEQDVINLYKTNGITRMRIYAPNEAILRALRGTNIQLILDVPNHELQSLKDLTAAKNWVTNNIQKYYPSVTFRYIAVGNEVSPINHNRQFEKFVLPALQNIHRVLKDLGLANQIKVSTATYTGLIVDAYPPSNAKFDPRVQEFIKPIITFLAQNNLPMLANIYPYFAYRGDPVNVHLSYALFTEPRRAFGDNGRDYFNLFDAMLDAHYAAQSRVGGENVEIVVSESGWPSAGHSTATIQNAATYLKNLIAHVKSAKGTPLKPGKPIETYLFAMFDENRKEGDETEKYFGIFTPDKKPKYPSMNF